MVSVFRHVVKYNGFIGSPGYATLSFGGTGAQSSIDATGADLRVFFNTLAPYMLSSWSWTFDNVINEHDSITGALTGQHTYSTPPTAVVGSVSSQNYTGGTGAWIAWKSSAIWQNHRVQGRTFLVPLVGVNSPDGTLLGTFVTVLQNAGTALVGSANSDLCVWSRQFSAPPKPVQVNGFLASVTQAFVVDKTGVLRSRRD